jgi:hypothetical protein
MAESDEQGDGDHVFSMIQRKALKFWQTGEVMVLAALLAVQIPYLARPEQFQTYARTAVSSGVESRVLELFQTKSDADYLLSMARGRGGLKNIKVSVIPSPPGWEDTAPFWAVFYTRQDIEEDHDPVYTLLRTTDGLKLGRELPEWAGIESRITHIDADVHIRPAANFASVVAKVTFDGAKTTRAPILRLADLYRVKNADEADRSDQIVKPDEGDYVRAGSLLIPWSKFPAKNLTFQYEGSVNSDNEDKINEHQVYLTAWWLPSAGRLPFTTRVRITGPRDWILKSEGPATDPSFFGTAAQPDSSEQVVAYKCDLPISYPKVIGGAYKLAAETKVGRKNFRAYHLDTAEPERGKKEVQAIADAIAFYEKTLGPFPFDHYYSFDALGYYGIESYSHTLLQRGNTLRFLSHEIGHTYFGGLVPNSYAKDTWNEGMTQYIDSIVYLKNADRSLEAGLRGMNINTPMSKMGIAHAYGSATYYRGAYVMRMLEDEIGQDKVLAGLRAIVKDRVGKDTTWPDLLPYFEEASGQKLGWFWSQWITNSRFPKLTVVDSEPVQVGRTWRTRVTVTQSGTDQPFRLRYKIVLRKGTTKTEKVVTTKAPGETFTVETDFLPATVDVDAFSYTLATVEKQGR